MHLVSDVLAQTFAALRRCGQGHCECVVYWTGPNDTDAVDRVEHPLHRRSPCGYELDGDWLTGFWVRLARESRSVKAQVHTHPGEAFHSLTDDRWPIVSQPGFVSIVIPDFASGSISFERAWIAQLDEKGVWRRIRNLDSQ
jgi:hypothetical protein